jgi:SHS2 domain-containing protein
VKQFDLVAHTADIRLVVQGTTLEELFCAALEGMASIIWHSTSSLRAIAGNPDMSKLSVHITTTSADITVLLIDFLSDVLTQTHLLKIVFTHVTFHELTQTHVNATIFGFNVNHFDEDIKGVTYHEANVIKNNDGNYQTTIVFDI